MGAYYDEVEIEDMAWDEEKGVFHYPCPCGDRFEITRKQLANYEDIAACPSCSLIIRVVYDPLDFEDDGDEDEEEASASESEESEDDDELEAQQKRQEDEKDDRPKSDAEEESFEDAFENLHIGGREDACGIGVKTAVVSPMSC